MLRHLAHDGRATVASCVVFDQNAMQTGQYRRFNIQTVSDGDDYGAMKEALAAARPVSPRKKCRTPTCG